MFTFEVFHMKIETAEQHRMKYALFDYGNAQIHFKHKFNGKCIRPSFVRYIYSNRKRKICHFKSLPLYSWRARPLNIEHCLSLLATCRSPLAAACNCCLLLTKRKHSLSNEHWNGSVGAAQREIFKYMLYDHFERKENETTNERTNRSHDSDTTNFITYAIKNRGSNHFQSAPLIVALLLIRNGFVRLH